MSENLQQIKWGRYEGKKQMPKKAIKSFFLFLFSFLFFDNTTFILSVRGNDITVNVTD